MSLHLGDCREVLRSLPAESVHCVVTSPPYWGLRDYGLEPVIWGGDPECKHEWRNESVDVERGAGNWTQAENGRGLTTGRHQTCFKGDTMAARANTRMSRAKRGTCAFCGAWRGVLGLESTPDLYVQHIVEVFREVRRVLRRDGTLWLNMGDSYASGMRSSYASDRHYGAARAHDQRPPTPLGIKPKDMIGMPWRVALALQADGWYLRSDIIWCKPSPMPESVRDRPTRAHEYLFLLAKGERYYYDAEAIAEWGTSGPSDVRKMAEQQDRLGGLYKFATDPLMAASALTNIGQHRAVGQVQRVPANWATGPGAHPSIAPGREHQNGQPTTMECLRARRNKRSWWVIASEPFAGAHFATFATKLVEPCVLAGTSEMGCCSRCGAPWERLVERMGGQWRPSARRARLQEQGLRTRLDGTMLAAPSVTTTGWGPSCRCQIALCSICATVLEYRNGHWRVQYDGSQGMEEGAPSRDSMQGLRSADGRSTLADERTYLLLQAVRRPNNSPHQAGDERVGETAEGVYPTSPAGAPDGEQRRVCDGAPISDGRASAENASAGGSGTPSQRHQGRQPNHKFRTDHQAGPRSDEEAAAGDGTLPTVPLPIQRQWPYCPNCHNPLEAAPFPAEPCTVLDCFVGSGTTAYVAHRLGRRAVGIDASAEYIEMARRRLAALPMETLL